MRAKLLSRAGPCLTWRMGVGEHRFWMQQEEANSDLRQEDEAHGLEQTRLSDQKPLPSNQDAV